MNTKLVCTVCNAAMCPAVLLFNELNKHNFINQVNTILTTGKCPRLNDIKPTDNVMEIKYSSL